MIAHQLIGEGLVCMRMIHHCGGLAQLEERVFVHPDMVRCESGQIGLPGKECVGNGTRVRIPISPPKNLNRLPV